MSEMRLSSRGGKAEGDRRDTRERGDARERGGREPEPRRRRPRWLRWAVSILVLALLVGGAGGWYFFLGGERLLAGIAPPPAPVFVETKPLVVTVKGTDDASHYLQLGLNLKVAGDPAAQAVRSVLPEIEDAMRLTILGYSADDLSTPAGVDRLRGALLARINEVLASALSPAALAAFGVHAASGTADAGKGDTGKGDTGKGDTGKGDTGTAGVAKPDAAKSNAVKGSASGPARASLVQNIYFSNLVIE